VISLRVNPILEKKPAQEEHMLKLKAEIKLMCLVMKASSI